jgi:hypothetical protein
MPKGIGYSKGGPGVRLRKFLAMGNKVNYKAPKETLQSRPDKLKKTISWGPNYRVPGTPRDSGKGWK